MKSESDNRATDGQIQDGLVYAKSRYRDAGAATDAQGFFSSHRPMSRPFSSQLRLNDTTCTAS